MKCLSCNSKSMFLWNFHQSLGQISVWLSSSFNITKTQQDSGRQSQFLQGSWLEINAGMYNWLIHRCRSLVSLNSSPFESIIHMNILVGIWLFIFIWYNKATFHFLRIVLSFVCELPSSKFKLYLCLFDWKADMKFKPAAIWLRGNTKTRTTGKWSNKYTRWKGCCCMLSFLQRQQMMCNAFIRFRGAGKLMVGRFSSLSAELSY